MGEHIILRLFWYTCYFGRHFFFLFYWPIAGIFSQRWGDLLLGSFTYTALLRDTCL